MDSTAHPPSADQVRDKDWRYGKAAAEVAELVDQPLCCGLVDYVPDVATHDTYKHLITEFDGRGVAAENRTIFGRKLAPSVQKQLDVAGGATRTVRAAGCTGVVPDGCLGRGAVVCAHCKKFGAGAGANAGANAGAGAGASACADADAGADAGAGAGAGAGANVGAGAGAGASAGAGAVRVPVPVRVPMRCRCGCGCRCRCWCRGVHAPRRLEVGDHAVEALNDVGAKLERDLIQQRPRARLAQVHGLVRAAAQNFHEQQPRISIMNSSPELSDCGFPGQIC
eukprot:COSAG01_NODE_909_length_12785_cov_4.201876_12_plen_282_part_00